MKIAREVANTNMSEYKPREKATAQFKHKPYESVEQYLRRKGIADGQESVETIQGFKERGIASRE